MRSEEPACRQSVLAIPQHFYVAPMYLEPGPRHLTQLCSFLRLDSSTQSSCRLQGYLHTYKKTQWN